MEQVEVLVITTKNVYTKVLNNDYKAFKKEIGITTPIDCIERKIGEKYFDIWIDDEGLYKEDRQSVAVNTAWEEILSGGIIIANHDDEGNTLSLSDDDIDYIKNFITSVKENFSVVYNTSLGPLEMKFEKGDNILIYGV